MEQRCFWPPETSCGRRPETSAKWNRSIISFTRRCRSRRRRRAPAVRFRARTRRNPAAAESAWRCGHESSNHLALLQAVGGVDDGDSDGGEYQDQDARNESVAAFDGVVDGDGGGLCPPRNI